MATFQAAPYDTTFARAEAFLAKGRNKGSRPLANNTRLVRVNDDAIAVVLHQTPVVTYHRSGEFTIYGGGWNTVTTKARIRDYSPHRVMSDGHGGWVVGYTGEITPPRVQKCRSCKGRGRWMADDVCWGPSTWAGQTACEHGATRYGRHAIGTQHEEVCYRCKGATVVDYGSKPVPVVLNSSTAYMVDADGAFVQIMGDPGYVGNGYAPPKPTPPPSHTFGSSLVEDLAAVLPNVKAPVRHPVSGEEGQRLDYVIVSLNDSHKWSRERIADWLETLDLDLRFTGK